MDGYGWSVTLHGSNGVVSKRHFDIAYAVCMMTLFKDVR